MTVDISEFGNPISEIRPYHTKTERDHLAAVGRVASEWAYLEFEFDVHALEMAKIPFETGLCFTSQVAGSARKLDAYIALARSLGATKLNQQFEQFAKDTAALAEMRNRIVHDPWLLGSSDGPTRIEATARKTLRFLVIQVPTAEVISTSFRITAHISRFEKLHESVLVELGTLPKTQP